MSSMSPWIESQFRALMDAGLNAMDAYNAVSWATYHMPRGMDPATWIPTAEQLVTPLDSGDVKDARVAWYVVAPEWAKRLLDAVEVGE